MAETFDDWAQRGRGEGMEEGHRLTAGDLIASLPIEPGTRFLDLGTGIGWAARDAADKGALAVGVDVAPKMLARARARQGPKVTFLQASFEDLPFQDGSFQLAFSMEALYYADDLHRALEEVSRAIVPGGRLHAIIDFYEENEASHAWPEKTGVPMHLLSEQAWLEALVAAGFQDASASRIRGEEGVGDAWKWEQGSLHLVATNPP